MKTLITCIIFSLACTSVIFAQKDGFNIYTDDFSKIEIKEFRCDMSSKEHNSPIDRGYFYFQNDSKDLTLYTVLSRSLGSFFPNNELQLFIDDELFILPITAFENDINKVPSSSSSDEKIDSVRTKTVTTTTYYEVNYVKFKIVLPVKVQLKLQNAGSISLRIYAGGRPSTFKIKDTRNFRKVLE